MEYPGALERQRHPTNRRGVLVSVSAAHRDAAMAVHARLIADLDRLIRRLCAAARADALELVPEVTALLQRRSDALIAEAGERLAAAPLVPRPWA